MIRKAGTTWPEVLTDRGSPRVERLRNAEDPGLRAENNRLRGEVERLRNELDRAGKPLRAPRLRYWRPRGWRDAVELALVWREIVTDWELGFITSISGRRELTPRQRDRLDELIDKVEIHARVRGFGT
jgi:hypothetical protein